MTEWERRGPFGFGVILRYSASVWRLNYIGVVAALTVAGILPCAAQASARPRISILAVDTNATFNFLPPPPVRMPTNPVRMSTNSVSGTTAFRSMRAQKLHMDGNAPREEVIRTVGGKPGEKEADAEQRPSATRDAAANAQRDEIMATTPVLPSAPLPDEKPLKDEKALWINLKPKDETPTGPQVPFDTWVLQPGDGRAAPDPQIENLPDRPSWVIQPAAQFDYTPSPFNLGSANKSAAPEPSSARGILSANPIDLPLFGIRHETASPQSQKPLATHPSPLAATKVPIVSPSSPFAPVEFTRDSPFGTRPAQGNPAFGGASPAQPLPPGSPSAVSRSPFAKPFPEETSRIPVKTRDEQAAEKWDKYFEDRKRGF